MITGYVGQAGQKTREMLTKARGKVLFIDEAYQLNPTEEALVEVVPSQRARLKNAIL